MAGFIALLHEHDSPGASIIGGRAAGRQQRAGSTGHAVGRLMTQSTDTVSE